MIRASGWAAELLPADRGGEGPDVVDWSLRIPLTPCGEQVAAQIPRLYPANQSQQALAAYARPSTGAFAELLSPQAYRRARDELRNAMRECDHPAARWLGEREDDERQLQMLVQLLIEV
ncbi:hypothetical protein P5705_14175 [Pseudomonas entomophila]|uniref:type III secretion apparatus assembly protein SctX n=1 Tax=Pseudomonas entomophila TaxID=312306 RepID=UPI0024060A66|nr:hypothetical protein [Pseudomonas entomophila]MDF9618795.1 hypothetical protein [Pseudomonas entomophila]